MAQNRPRQTPRRPGPSVPKGPDGRRAWATISAAVLILAAGFAAYANSFQGVFVFDDEPAIARNENLQALWPLTRAMSAPEDTTLSGRPVAALSFAIDHAIHGGSLLGFHATNLAIHLIAGLLLFGIVRRTLETEAVGDAVRQSAPGLALATALLFVVHPLQTGAVTYLMQRVESLMGCLFLATIYSAIRAHSAGPSARFLWFGLAVAMCGLGMATKEVMVTAPLIVILWDYLFAPGRGRQRLPLYAALVSTWLVLGVLVASGARTGSVGFGFEAWPWWRYLLTQAEVLIHYIRLSLYPSPLVLDYDWPAVASWTDVALEGGLVLGLLGATLLGVIRKHPAAFAGAWFFLILAPTSSVLPIVTEVAAEHRMYLPLAGVIVIAVITCFQLLRRLTERRVLEPPTIAMVAKVLLGTTVVVFAWMTHNRNEDYQDFDRIWLDTIAKRPGNARARNNYATSLLVQGRFADAEVHLRAAVARNMSFAEAEANLGVALSAQGQLDEGATHLERALVLRPEFAEANRNLGENYAMRGMMKEAVAAYGSALKRLPDDVRLLNRLGWILATHGNDGVRDGVRARSLAERAVALTDGRDPESLDTLGAALAEVGAYEQAQAIAARALSLATEQGNAELSKDLRFRLERYSSRQPFRDSTVLLHS